MFNFLPMPATVTDVRPVTARESLLTIRLDNGKSLRHRPCQFVLISLFGIGEAPISISSPPGNSAKTFELCIRSMGNLTNAMHKLSVNDKIGIRGPYGNGFPIEKIGGKDILIVAGGPGVAALRRLI